MTIQHVTCEHLWDFSQSFFKGILERCDYEQYILPIQARFDDEACLELVFPNRHIKRAFTTQYIF